MVTKFNFEEFFNKQKSITPTEDGDYELNIQPQASVLGVFSRLNYKAWYAIAEFVDNSTESFYSNEQDMKSSGISSITVRINYDFVNNILTVADDAYGMELEDFSRAVLLDSKPKNQGGRNEFGMGLKTAASWFGNIWSVTSTQLGSPNKYITEVNIKELKEKKANTVKIKRELCDENEHGTTITIKDVTKKIDASRTKGKIIQLLESMYRRDLNSGKVNIWFNDIPLHFDGYDCLKFRGKTWRKELNFKFDFDGQSHHVKGFIGILANGGFGKAGFALFRRNRVVIGGEDQNYKPEYIFHQAQSPISHKLFGELDLDDFPVNQAKDGFVWDDGLENAFLDALKESIQEYIDIAKMTNKERAKEEEFSQESSTAVQKSVQPFTQALSITNLGSVDNTSQSYSPHTVGSEIAQFEEYLHDTNNIAEKIVGTRRTYPIQINEVVKKDFVVEWSIGTNTYWINVDESEDGQEISIKININHPFFKPYSNNEDFKIVLEKFVISFVVAEQQAKLISNKEGYIPAATIRHKMNEFLSTVSEG
ncbi:MAG: hypothetical protein HFG45_06695 [Oscillospiraceae bacterium]|jgi:hypothetical protein|nr:hypothetical protein [Oscillospiraceae bacterium]